MIYGLPHFDEENGEITAQKSIFIPSHFTAKAFASHTAKLFVYLLK